MVQTQGEPVPAASLDPQQATPLPLDSDTEETTVMPAELAPSVEAADPPAEIAASAAVAAAAASPPPAMPSMPESSSGWEVTVEDTKVGT